MARVYQVPQHAFVWLILGTALACVPHLINAPFWLVAYVVGLLCWRLLVQRGRLRMPGRLMRAALLGVAILATLYTYGTITGPEAGIALLICAYNLKLLEMFKMRDAYVSVVLCYFVLATVLLVSQNFFTTLYVFASLIVVTAALIGVNQPEANLRARNHLRYASVVVLQAIPLMIFLFVTVPRVSPLWELPVQSKRSKTGMSDSMALGEISELSRSSELAFRVQFEGDSPPPHMRYWRGLTYSWFDGRNWSQAVPRHVSNDQYVVFPDQPKPTWYQRLSNAKQAPVYRYQIILEPTAREWLYAMATPFSNAREIGLVRDARLVNKVPVMELKSYNVTSYPGVVRELELADWERQFNLHLPARINPRARALALSWRQQLRDDRAFAQRLMSWYRTEPFFYTLQPPPLGEDQIDDFLFNTRAGFCEHYASSATFMLRSAGIPARIVAGYQGGELNPLGTHLLVRQYDAHAWVEAWLPGEGWVELDPTAMVAPERIEQGIEQALALQGESFSEAFKDAAGLARLPLLKQLADAADYVQYNWTRLVLGYSAEAQQSLLKRWLGDISPLRVAMLLGAGILVMTLMTALYLWWAGRGPRLSWWQREYWYLLRGLQRRGAAFGAEAGPRTLYQLGSQRWPAASEALKRWTGIYLRVAYAASEHSSDQDEAEQKRALREARRAVLKQIR